MSSLKDKKFSVVDALTMACCIYREKGYTSTSTYTATSPDNEDRWNNKEHLTYQLIPAIAGSDYKVLFKVTKEDLDAAGEIIKYFRRLTFGVIGNSLSDYMARVFKVTQAEELTVADFGVLASIPHVYEKEITEKLVRDEAKKTVQDHFGILGHTVTLTVRIIRSKFVQQIGCFSHEGVTNDNYLVSFLNKEQLGQLGDVCYIRAKIKKHGENYTTKTPETQLNYVKVLDKELVWQ